MAHRYRLCPDETQEAVLLEHCAHARFVWNLTVEQQSWWRPGRGSAPSPAARMRQLAEARAAEPWLAQGSSSVQQQALRDFSHAMAALENAELSRLYEDGTISAATRQRLQRSLDLEVTRLADRQR